MSSLSCKYSFFKFFQKLSIVSLSSLRVYLFILFHGVLASKSCSSKKSTWTCVYNDNYLCFLMNHLVRGDILQICMDVCNIYIILDMSTGILGYGTILSLELIDEHISWV